MKLTLNGLIADRQAYLDAAYRIPSFDYEGVKKNTQERPVWVHFGAGNIFRAFPCHVLQTLLNQGILDTGLIAVEGYDYEIIDKMNLPHDNLSILANLKADNTVEKTVIGSIMESLVLDRERKENFLRLQDIFTSPSLQMASFTITEKGYSITDSSGTPLPYIVSDFEKGPLGAESYLGKVASLLYTRFQNGTLPLAMVSMDNCSHNGDKLKDAMIAFADAWAEKGLSDAGFPEYVKDSGKVSFPWTMIDKITPRPDPAVEEMLRSDGIEDLDAVVTSKNTYIAPFVNAEECEYLVIEDQFPAGRPALEKGGILFTTRETVDKVEKMKVCTCLNPLHTTLAIFGCLLGYEKISEEMKHPHLKELVRKVGYTEGLPVVVHPEILDPLTFIDEVVEIRIPNPFLPDTPQRIATDTSQKLAIRFGETIKAYAADPSLDVLSLEYIPFVLAGWLRYLMALDDRGNTFPLSSDPLLETVSAYVAPYRLNGEPKDLSLLDELLGNTSVFGVNLHQIGLASKVKDYFARLSGGPGAIEKTLAELFL